MITSLITLVISLVNRLRNTIIGLVSIFISSWCLSAAESHPNIDDDFRSQLRSAIETADSFTDKFDAEVWIKDMSSRLAQRASHIPQSERLDILTLIHREATRNKLSPQLVLALIQIESNFDRFAISKAGAQGLMQVMPFWKDEIGHPEDNLFDPATNLKYGCAILRIYMRREKEDIRTALARYHGSYPKDYYARKVIKAWQTRWLYL